jgi:hypothetical protein
VNDSNESQEENGAGWYLGLGSMIVLGVAMLLYLGLHSYNFFTFTFKGDQWIFAILGLFTTSIGFLLWLAIYLWMAKDGLSKAVAIMMMFVSLGGEFVVAGFDMFMNISGRLEEAAWTATDLKYMSYAIAGLALLNGLALVADIAGKRIMDDLRNVKLPKRNRESNANVTPALAPVTVNAAETKQVTLNTQVPEPAIPQQMEAGPKEIPFQRNGRSH